MHFKVASRFIYKLNDDNIKTCFSENLIEKTFNVRVKVKKQLWTNFTFVL